MTWRPNNRLTWRPFALNFRVALLLVALAAVAVADVVGADHAHRAEGADRADSTHRTDEPPAPRDVSYWAAPRTFGLDIPPGTVTEHTNRYVLAADDDGRPVVARVYVQVDDHLVLLLPDGRLIARAADDCQPTERPFQVLDGDAVAERLVATEFPGWRTQQSVRYVYLHQDSDAFVKIASRILETMFRGIVRYARAQRIDVRAPEFPLVVVVYRTQQQFQQALGTPDDVVAYYDVLTNRISLCEESNLWKVRPELAVRQTISTIAHEGAHQILYNIGVQQRLSLWPMWLNEGLAEYFAPTTTDHRLMWKGAGEINDLRMYELEELLKSRTAETADGQWIAQTIGAARLTSTGYAMAWALTHYLAQNHRDAFRRLLRTLSDRGPLESGGPTVPPGVIPDNLRDFKEYFGENLAEIERRVILHLNRQPYLDPFLDWPHFTVLILMPDSPRPRRIAGVFRLPQQAEHWRDRQEATLSDSQKEAFQSTIREFPNRVQAEQYARQWRQPP